MDRISLKAKERSLLGKKVKKLRDDGFIPAHVFGKGLESEHVQVSSIDFIKTFHQAGETGLIDLKIGDEKVKPVLIRGVQYDPVKGNLLHIDFYQVDLKQKVRAPIPLELVGEETELIHLGEAVILQTLNEVEVEALPTDLVEKIEVDITSLQNIDDAILVSGLNYDREKLTVLAEGEEVVVKLAPAITEEMKKLMEEQEAEAQAAQAEAQAEEAGEAAEGVEGEQVTEGEEEVGVQEGEAQAEQSEATEEKK